MGANSTTHHSRERFVSSTDAYDWSPPGVIMFSNQSFPWIFFPPHMFLTCTMTGAVMGWGQNKTSNASLSSLYPPLQHSAQDTRQPFPQQTSASLPTALSPSVLHTNSHCSSPILTPFSFLVHHQLVRENQLRMGMMHMRLRPPLLSLLLLLFLLFPSRAASNPLSAAVQLARLGHPLSIISHVASQTLGYGHQFFIIATKSRAVGELFLGIDEVKACLQDPASRTQWWGRRNLKRDKSGCVIGLLRTTAAAYLIKTDLHRWLTGDYVVENVKNRKWKQYSKAM